MLAIFLVCLVGFAAAQQPRPCVSPSQWEGRVFDSNEKQRASLRGRISYDAIYHRTRLIDNVETSTTQISNDILSLYESRIEFVFDLKTHTCTRRPITQPWRDFGILPDAVSLGEAYLGASAFPDASLLVTIWSGNFTLPTNETLPYVGTWTYRACLPVSRSTFSEKYGNEILSFYDLTTGISDPNVFIPRPECLSEEEYAKRHILFGVPAKKD